MTGPLAPLPSGQGRSLLGNCTATGFMLMVASLMVAVIVAAESDSHAMARRVAASCPT